MLRNSVPLARAAAAETLDHLGDPDPIVRSIAQACEDRLVYVRVAAAETKGAAA